MYNMSRVYWSSSRTRKGNLLDQTNNEKSIDSQNLHYEFSIFK